MTTKTILIKRLLSVLLLILMIGGSFGTTFVAVGAADVIKNEETYDIAIVFDNSGSMYQDNGKVQQRWCHAKYAMEIFASMLDYEKDRLRIFPMWELTYDGKTIPKPDKALKGGNIIAEDESGNPIGKYDPIEIKSVSDIDYIHNIYTTRWAAGTPYAPALEAHEALKDSDASQKWVIVLSDGVFNLRERNKGVSYNGDLLKEEFLNITKDGIKVQYLGFGSATAVEEAPDQGLYTKYPQKGETYNGDVLKNNLVEVCNRIFKRDELPDKYLNGTTLKLDMSMRKLIVFVQGAGAKIGNLKDSGGKEYTPVMDAGQRTYSDIIAYGYSGGIDTGLAGQVVTFGECAKGEYTLDYSGVEKIQIFYEPDVDIEVVLVNSDNAEIDGDTESIPAGEYKVVARIVDSKTGEDVTNHELMGGDVDIKVGVKTSEDDDYTEYENGTVINFEPDEETDILITGTYLKNYTITSEGDADLSWLKGISFDIPVHDFKIEASVTQPDSTYKIKERDSWQPVQVKVKLNGEALTDEQLDKVTLELGCNPEIALRYEAVPGSSAFNVYIAESADGSYKEPAAGDYSLNITATYSDDNGDTSAMANASFKVESYEFVIDAQVLQSKSWYTLSEHESWQPVKVVLTIDGQPLTEEQFATIDLKHTVDKSLEYRVEALPSESAYLFYIGQNDKGEYVEPEADGYKMTFSAVYTTEGGNPLEAEDTAKFTISVFKKMIWDFLWLIIIGIALVILVIILNIPVLPAQIYLNVDGASFPVSISGSNVGLSSSLYEGVLSCEAKPASPLSKRGKTSARFAIKDVHPAFDVISYSIGGSEYTKDDAGNYVDSRGKTISENKPMIHNTAGISWQTKNNFVEARIFINHN